MSIEVQVQTVTPQEAEALIAATTNQRLVRERVVRKIVGDIANGRWQMNGQSIVLSEDGKVLDGQHRLIAIARAGVPVPVLVARGVAPTAFATMDSGTVRSLADKIGDAGEWSSANKLAAVVVAMLGNGTSSTASHATMLQVYHDVYQPFMVNLPPAYTNTRLMASVVAAVVAARCFGVDHDRCDTFIEGVQTGFIENATTLGSSAVVARNLVTHTVPHGQGARATLYRKVQRCLQAYVTGETLKKVYAPTSPIWDVSSSSEWMKRNAPHISFE